MQADLNRRKSYVAAGAAAVAARPSITIDTRQEWAGGADGGGNSAHSLDGEAAAAAVGTPCSANPCGVRGDSPRHGSPHASNGFRLAAAGIAGNRGIQPIAVGGGGGDSSSDASHSMAGDSSSSFGTCGVAESASTTGHSPRMSSCSWPAGQGASPRDGYSRRQPAQWTLPPTVIKLHPPAASLLRCQQSSEVRILPGMVAAQSAGDRIIAAVFMVTTAAAAAAAAVHVLLQAVLSIDSLATVSVTASMTALC